MGHCLSTLRACTVLAFKAYFKLVFYLLRLNTTSANQDASPTAELHSSTTVSPSINTLSNANHAELDTTTITARPASPKSSRIVTTPCRRLLLSNFITPTPSITACTATGIILSDTIQHKPFADICANSSIRARRTKQSLPDTSTLTELVGDNDVVQEPSTTTSTPVGPTIDNKSSKTVCPPSCHTDKVFTAALLPKLASADANEVEEKENVCAPSPDTKDIIIVPSIADRVPSAFIKKSIETVYTAPSGTNNVFKAALLPNFASAKTDEVEVKEHVCASLPNTNDINDASSIPDGAASDAETKSIETVCAASRDTDNVFIAALPPRFASAETNQVEECKENVCAPSPDTNNVFNAALLPKFVSAQIIELVEESEENACVPFDSKDSDQESIASVCPPSRDTEHEFNAARLPNFAPAENNDEDQESTVDDVPPFVDNDTDQESVIPLGTPQEDSTESTQATISPDTDAFASNTTHEQSAASSGAKDMLFFGDYTTHKSFVAPPTTPVLDMSNLEPVGTPIRNNVDQVPRKPLSAGKRPIHKMKAKSRKASATSPVEPKSTTASPSDSQTLTLEDCLETSLIGRCEKRKYMPRFRGAIGAVGAKAIRQRFCGVSEFCLCVIKDARPKFIHSVNDDTFAADDPSDGQCNNSVQCMAYGIFLDVFSLSRDAFFKAPILDHAIAKINEKKTIACEKKIRVFDFWLYEVLPWLKAMMVTSPMARGDDPIRDDDEDDGSFAKHTPSWREPSPNTPFEQAEEMMDSVGPLALIKFTPAKAAKAVSPTFRADSPTSGYDSGAFSPLNGSPISSKSSLDICVNEAQEKLAPFDPLVRSKLRTQTASQSSRCQKLLLEPELVPSVVDSPALSKFKSPTAVRLYSFSPNPFLSMLSGSKQIEIATPSQEQVKLIITDLPTNAPIPEGQWKFQKKFYLPEHPTATFESSYHCTAFPSNGTASSATTLDFRGDPLSALAYINDHNEEIKNVEKIVLHLRHRLTREDVFPTTDTITSTKVTENTEDPKDTNVTKTDEFLKNNGNDNGYVPNESGTRLINNAATVVPTFTHINPTSPSTWGSLLNTISTLATPLGRHPHTHAHLTRLQKLQICIHDWDSAPRARRGADHPDTLPATIANGKLEAGVGKGDVGYVELTKAGKTAGLVDFWTGVMQVGKGLDISVKIVKEEKKKDEVKEEEKDGEGKKKGGEGKKRGGIKKNKGVEKKTDEEALLEEAVRCRPTHFVRF